MKKFLLLSSLLFLTCAKEDSQNPNTPPSQIINQYTLTVSAGDGGSVSTTGGTFSQGTQVNITATPNPGHSFVSWSNGSTANPLTVNLNSNITVTANFQVIVTYTLTVNAGEGGTVSGGGEYEEGTQVSIQANPDEDYEFLSWSNGSTDNPLTLTVDSDISIEATFENVLENYRENTLNKIYGLQDYINEIETKSEIISSYNSLIDEITNNSISIEIINDKYSQFINNQFKPKYLNYLGIEDGIYLELRGKYFERDNIEELSNIEDESLDYLPTEIIINEKYWATFSVNDELPLQYNRNFVKIENGKIIEDWKIRNAFELWYNVSGNDLSKYRSYYKTRDYTYKETLGEKTYAWEGQDAAFGPNYKLNYYSNYKILDYGVISADLINPPTPDNGEKPNMRRKYFYKLNNGILNLNDDISFESKLINNSIPFEDLKGVYDYYSEEEFLSDPIYKNIDIYNPYTILEAFIKDGERYGYVFPHSLDYYMEKSNFRYVYNSTGSDTQGMTGYCAYKNGGIGGATILHSTVMSNPFTDKQRGALWIYYHEFGHALLGLGHTCGGIMNGGGEIYSCDESWPPAQPTNTLNLWSENVSNLFTGTRQHVHCQN